MTTTLIEALSYNTDNYSTVEPPSKLLGIIAALQSAYKPTFKTTLPNEPTKPTEPPLFTGQWDASPTPPNTFVYQHLKTQLQKAEFKINELASIVGKLRIRNERKRKAIIELERDLANAIAQRDDAIAKLKNGPNKESFDRVQKQYEEHIAKIQKELIQKISDRELAYERLAKQYNKQTETITTQASQIKELTLCNKRQAETINAFHKRFGSLDKPTYSPASPIMHGKFGDVEVVFVEASMYRANKDRIANAIKIAKSLRSDLKNCSCSMNSCIEQADKLLIELSKTVL